MMQVLTTAAVIDDDKDTVEVFAEYLQICKVNVVAFGYDGKAAVDIYKKYRPDIVFLDMLMPQYDGIYALREIRTP
jgi:two-component system chemotaxis response regulator CheY